MADEQYAFLKSTAVPTRDQWQEAIVRAGFDLNLDPQLEPRMTVGFVPCQLNGIESGVEIYFDDSKDLIEAFQPIAGNRDCCISFRWGGDLTECACAMVASYALAEAFGAIVSYEGEPPPDDLQQFRQETEAVIAEAAKST